MVFGVVERAHSANKDYSWMNDGAGADKLSEEMKLSYETVAENADDTHFLHVIDRFPISLDAWDQVVLATSDLLNIQPADSVFDAGCGCGAWLDSLERQFPQKMLEISGLDFASGLIDIANRRLPQGKWRVGDARQYTDIPDDSFDVSVSFGVFFYFDGIEEVQAGFEELVRVTKPGGRLMVGRMNSKEVFDKMGEAAIKKNYAKYVPRQAKVDSSRFWHSEAHRLGVNLIAVKRMDELYDLQMAQDRAMGALRHCAYFEKPINYQTKPEDGDQWADWPENMPSDCDCIGIAEALKGIGNSALKAGELERALYKYRKALRYLEAAPQETAGAVRVACLLNSALCLSKQSKHSECVSTCAQVIAIDSESAKAFYRRGSAHLAMNEPDVAESDLLRALELNPEDKAIKAELAKVAIFWQKLQKQEARMAKKMLG